MLVGLLAIGLSLSAVLVDWKSNPGSLLRGKVSVTSVYLYFYLTFYFLGGTYLYLTVSPNGVFLLSLCLGLLIPVLLSLYLRTVLKTRAPKVLPLEGFSDEVAPPKGWRYPAFSWFLILTASLVSIFGVVWYFVNAGVPLISLLTGEATNLRALRRDTVANFGGAFFFRGLFSVVHVLAIFFFVRSISKPTIRRVSAAVLWVLGASLMYLASTEKAPVLLFWASLVVAFGYQRNKLRLSQAAKGFLILGTICYLITITMMTYGNDVRSAIGLVMERIFVYQVAGTFYAYEFFPNQIDFLFGQSYHLPSFIVPEKFPLELYLFQIVFGSGSTGTAPPGVMANGYANFGLAFSIMEYTITFLLLLLLERTFTRRRDDFAVACRAWLTLYVTQVITAGSSAAVLLSPGFLLVVALFLATAGGRPVTNGDYVEAYLQGIQPNSSGRACYARRS